MQTIAFNAPLGKALSFKKPGEEVKFKTPGGNIRQIKILSVE
ncbi:MAG: GreA/GreB family elongation factor [Patescibacteria group bacterium]